MYWRGEGGRGGIIRKGSADYPISKSYHLKKQGKKNAVKKLESKKA